MRAVCMTLSWGSLRSYLYLGCILGLRAVSALLIAFFSISTLGIKEVSAASQTVSALVTERQRQVIHELLIRNFIGITRMGSTNAAEFRQRIQAEQLKSASCASGCELSYINKGASGVFSGDFFDLQMLDDEHMLVRFGDVMGHDLLAATVATALETGFHDREIQALMRKLYLQHGTEGQKQALITLRDALRLKKSMFYTLTDSVINLRSRQVSSLFLGSDYFMRATKTSDGFVVDNVGDMEARLTFMMMSEELIMPEDADFEAVKPHVSNYESGEYLVYISDGLLGRMVGEELLAMMPLAQQIVAQSLSETEDFADVAATISEKMLAISAEYTELDDITVLVLKLP
ncbi:MAG: SpoIIE family protein phosphatase [Pseudomonadota bacterium]|nr:SpoIIE family protein phosphatase [Pseudomonadota bacterium]